MKYRFKIIYQTPQLIQVNEFMQKLDVFAENTNVGFEEIHEFNYTGDPKPISYFK